MAFGTSVFLFAVGAILAYGVTAEVEGIDLDVVGVVLMIVGAVGFVLSALFWSSSAPWRSGRHVEQSESVRERDGEIVDREFKRSSTL